ncbi:MAG: hypothetical protein M0036_09925 [Desulfobacteraceae bacterium]|nr:hypothetical protein [Desulfobacteraceae bacterium]
MAAFKIHSSNLLYIGICALGMLAFAMVGIFPNMSASRQLDEELVLLNQKVQAQELLYPIYIELMRQFRQQAPENLALPQSSKVAKSKIADLTPKFAELARLSEVHFERATPDPISYQEETGKITMNVSFSGDFFNFRKLLMNICKMDLINSIEEMNVGVDGNIKRLQLKLLVDQE